MGYPIPPEISKIQQNGKKNEKKESGDPFVDQLYQFAVKKRSHSIIQ